MAARLPFQRADAKPVATSTIVALLVLVLVAGGAFVLRRSDDASLRFARSLPAYHQLSGDDVLSEPGTDEAFVVGRYTTRPADEGQGILVDELGPRLADLTLNQDTITILPSLNTLAEVVYPGDLLRLHELGSATQLCPIRVLGTQTSDGTADRIIAALPQSETVKINRVSGAEALVAVRIWGYAEGEAQPPTDELCS